MTDPTPEELRAKADRYRTMAMRVIDARLIDALTALASQYDELAAAIELEQGDE